MPIIDNNLEQSASKYESSIFKGWRKLLIKKRDYLYQKGKSFAQGEDVLEIGCGEGLLTELIVNDFKNVDVLEGAQFFIDQLKDQPWTKNVRFIQGLFPDYKPTKLYDFIFFSHILEHLEHPIESLAALKNYLKPTGRACIAVPNANSWNRQLGVKMGLIPSVDTLTEQDIDLGHYRVYTPELFKDHIKKAGLKLVHFGGNMFKPITNRQIEESWSDELIDACFALGEDYPQYCSEMFAIIEV